MAIKDSYPAIRPSLDLNFAGSRMVDPRITFTRASTATYFDDKGVMRTAPDGVPRIDFDPVTGECKGLLIEDQKTNLLTYSEQFDNVAWVKINATITANTATAPDSSMTADKFEPTGTGASYLYQGKILTQGQEYTLSVFIKLVSGSGIVWLRDFTEPGKAEFNIVNGTVGTASGIATKPQMTAFDNGWYRISAVFTPTIATGNHNISCVHPASPSPGQGFYSWGAQLEQGTFPTSCIKTEASQVTRAADAASMTGANFSSWYRQDEGTLFAEASYNGSNSDDATTSGIVSAGDGSGENFISIVARTDISSSRFAMPPGFPITTGSGSYKSGTFAKFASAYKDLDSCLAKDGSAFFNTTNLVNINPFTQLIIGAYYTAGSRRLNGHIRRIAYYPKRLTNEQLQALTV